MDYSPKKNCPETEVKSLLWMDGKSMHYGKSADRERHYMMSILGKIKCRYKELIYKSKRYSEISNTKDAQKMKGKVLSPSFLLSTCRKSVSVNRCSTRT